MAFKKGNIPWNKGLKGKYHLSNSTQFKKGNIPWNKGIPMDPKVKLKLIESHIGKKQTKESNVKRSKSMKEFYKTPKGQIVKEQLRQKRINDVSSGRVKTTKGINPWNLFKNPEETKKKLREKRKLQAPPTLGRKWTDEQRQKYMKSMEKVGRLPPLIHQNTSIEIKIQKELKKLGYNFETHLGILGCRPDIVFPEKKVVIFCDGDYWHNLPNYVIRDKKINKRLIENGWKVLRFWEHEINENIKSCADKIEEELKWY